jgi:hypothetical protein
MLDALIDWSKESGSVVWFGMSWAEGALLYGYR